MKVYACCDHCMHDAGEYYAPDHTYPCDHGCNDGEQPIEAS